MRSLDTQAKPRLFLDPTFELSDWNSVLPYVERLNAAVLEDPADVEQFCLQRSELESYLSENMAWRYIRMSCDNQNPEHQAAYQYFLEHILPQWSVLEDQWNRKVLGSGQAEALDSSAHRVMWRGMRKALEIFREENIPLFTELSQLSTEYGSITGGLMVDWEGKELTLQQAAALLESTDRSLRQAVYEKISDQRLSVTASLNTLFDQLIAKRHLVAQQAGFDNFRDYAFASMGRFDYSKEDCFEFHRAVEQTFKPLLNRQAKNRQKAMGLSALKPWDKAVDPYGRGPLSPFSTGSDLLEKTLKVFDAMDPFLGDCLRTMQALNRFDLDSRKGKNPGGYNYPLEESGYPFIFMNAAGQVRDVVTLLHEGGHALHSILTKDLPLNAFRNVPSEVAELASMSMELISMEHWDAYFADPLEAKRAKLKHLEDILDTLPWVATIDAFQHWIYEHPGHSHEQRNQAWLEILSRFSDEVTDWSGCEAQRAFLWQKQLHLYEVPFYYIEYGMAQLGALAIWRNYCQNPSLALQQYLDALALGYTKTIPEIYETAGISFKFSPNYIADLMAFLQEKMEELA